MGSRNQTVETAPEGQGGFAAALAAYALWGIVPLYYRLLDGVPALETIAHRIIWTVILLVPFVVLTRRLGEVVAIMRTPRLIGALALSGLLIAGNWLVFVHAINIHRTIEISLGYFTLPLFSMALGVFLLGERLRWLQMIAILLALIGVGQEMLRLGSMPWIALSLALLFVFYGYLRKVTAVGAATGLLCETLVLMPLAMGAIIVLADGHGGQTLEAGPLLWVLFAGTGIVTGIPLILFAYGARRLPMTVIGLLQYIAPSMQLVIGAFVFGEDVTPVRMVTMGFVWVALALFTWDQLRARRRR